MAATKVIVMVKKSVGTITLEQNENGYFYTRDGITMKMADATVLNGAYKALKDSGWVVKDPETAKKAPQNPTNKFKWNKEGRKIWAVQAQIYKRYFQDTNTELAKLKGKEYHDRLDTLVKTEMKVFEAKMAAIVNANI